jgi:hypothetical protein
MALDLSQPKTSSGAGYDDQNNNSDVYVDRGNAGGGRELPGWSAFEHSAEIECSLEIWQMQEGIRINNFDDPI